MIPTLNETDFYVNVFEKPANFLDYKYKGVSFGGEELVITSQETNSIEKKENL